MRMLLREVLGETLRSARLAQRRTLREISATSTVSLGYLSEIERGQKEASSELLAAICHALDIELSYVLRQASHQLEGSALATVTSLPTSRGAGSGLAGVHASAHAA
ncbi:MAG: helix-turn-helix domain-containing protein [Mycobacteriales bacterium]